MNRIERLQQARNEQTSGAWESFESHRSRVTQLLLQAAPANDQTGGRLCVLGAGNCNDLDLAALGAAFSEVELVDIDGDSLRRGVSRQQLPPGDRLRLHGDIDIGGIVELLNSCSPGAPADDKTIEAIIQQAHAAPGFASSSPFDASASVCLLSQLIDAVGASIGENHPRFFNVVEAVRRRHLRLLLELTKPGGAAVLITDFVSSDTLPEMPMLADDDFPGAVTRAIEQRNFFTGVNPFVLQQLFAADPQIAPWAVAPRLSPPWRWTLGPRMYAVCAIVALRKTP